MSYDDLVDIAEACKVIGGKLTPIDKATFYRGITRGDYPPGIKVSPNRVRWPRSELIKFLERAAADRGLP